MDARNAFFQIICIYKSYQTKQNQIKTNHFSTNQQTQKPKVGSPLLEHKTKDVQKFKKMYVREKEKRNNNKIKTL